MTEADETVELQLRPDPDFTPQRIRPRNADGSACADDVCALPVTIAANDGPAVERIVISPVPPEASVDHGPVYRMEDFLALPEGAVHGQGATLTFTLTLDTEVTVGSRSGGKPGPAPIRDLRGGTFFAATAEAGRRGYVSVWGRGAVTRFDGREGDLNRHPVMPFST